MTKPRAGVRLMKVLALVRLEDTVVERAAVIQATITTTPGTAFHLGLVAKRNELDAEARRLRDLLVGRAAGR